MHHSAQLITPKHLQAQPQAFNIASLTKNSNTQCQALNMAFFVSKIHALGVSIGMKNRNRISQYGRVKERIKDLFEGKKFNRVVAISDTRPPVKLTGGLAKNNYGGQPMPNTSTTPTVGQFSFSIELPANSYIKRFIAHGFNGSWFLTIQTEANQTATIRNTDTNTPKQFDSLDSIATWLASQGVDEMTVFLSNVGGAE